MTTEPKNLAEEHRITVPGYKWGPTKHESGDFEITPEWFEKYLEGFKVLTENGFYPPVLRQHKSDGKGKEARPLEDGFVYGKLVDTFKDDEGVKHVLEVPEEIKKAFDDGYIDTWSPSFRENWEHPHIDKVLKLSPRHVAFVSMPHQKNLGPSSSFYSLGEESVYSLSEGMLHKSPTTQPPNQTTSLNEDDMANAEEEDNATDNEETAKLDQVIDMLGQLLAGMAQDNAEHDDEEELEMEEGAKDKELAEARATIKALRGEKTRSVLTKIGIKEDDLEELVELSEKDPHGYASRVVELTEARGAGGRLPEKGGNGSGNESDIAPDPTRSVEEAIELAESDLTKKGKLKDLSAAEKNKMIVQRSRELRAEA